MEFGRLVCVNCVLRSACDMGISWDVWIILILHVCAVGLQHQCTTIVRRVYVCLSLLLYIYFRLRWVSPGRKGQQRLPGARLPIFRIDSSEHAGRLLLHGWSELRCLRREYTVRVLLWHCYGVTWLLRLNMMFSLSYRLSLETTSLNVSLNLHMSVDVTERNRPFVSGIPWVLWHNMFCELFRATMFFFPLLLKTCFETLQSVWRLGTAYTGLMRRYVYNTITPTVQT